MRGCYSKSEGCVRGGRGLASCVSGCIVRGCVGVCYGVERS